jgi:hypothetical protein
MMSIKRFVWRCSVAVFVLTVCTRIVEFSEARAGVIVSTLGLSNDGPFPGEQVGAAIQIGSTPISLSSVLYTNGSSGPTLGETFAVYGRNADGTVGSSLFTDFSLSYDRGSLNTTATATAPLTLQANTSYWLMMIEIPGTFGDWDSSLAFTYTSTFGVSIPTSNSSVSFFSGSYQYLNLTDGLQLFQLTGEALPEPSSLALATTSAVIMLGATWLRRRRVAKPARSVRG